MAEEFAEPVRQSYLMWLISALGWKYTLLLPLAGLVAFALTLALVIRGRGAAQVGALLFIVPLPFYLGIVGVLDGVMAMYQVIAMSDTTPKPSMLAMGISMALVAGWVGMLLTVPSYLAASAGLLIRAFFPPAVDAENPIKTP